MSFSTDPDLYVPRVITPLDAYDLNECTSKQRVILRTVFAMINGQRTIAQIKAQLHLSSKSVDEALAYMQWIGILE
ncbi:MAG TPA: hypothetical protein VII61_16680 [Ktedonobacteraceae bacterium]|jgi:hypothetical protein